MTLQRETVHRFFQNLQDGICSELEAVDGQARFREDTWTIPKGSGGGRTRVIQDGAVFEKGGVNFSAVESILPKSIADRMGIDPQHLFATGISLVLHPRSPMIPTVHMNLRYLELEQGDPWFGGGADLTPFYLFEEDAVHFHRTLKAVCDRHDPAYYPRFKQWCDEYFFIPHRHEARGIGGIFFDDQKTGLAEFFEFVRDFGNTFTSAYLPIVARRRAETFTGKEKQWQLVRRGRYVEFNLVYDRGTIFGLETRGRTESILMSLPPEVKWVYDFDVQKHSREDELLSVLRQPKEWV